MAPQTGDIEIASPRGLLRLRPEQQTDAAFRLQLFWTARPDLALLPLDRAARDQLVNVQFHAQAQGYHASFPHARFDIIERAGVPIGRIVVDRSSTFMRIVDQALLPAERNSGTGSAIMGALMQEAGLAGRAVRLSVAAGNEAAMRLYLRLGFVSLAQEASHFEMEWRAELAKRTSA